MNITNHPLFSLSSSTPVVCNTTCQKVVLFLSGLSLGSVAGACLSGCDDTKSVIAGIFALFIAGIVFLKMITPNGQNATLHRDAQKPEEQATNKKAAIFQPRHGPLELEYLKESRFYTCYVDGIPENLELKSHSRLGVYLLFREGVRIGSVEFSFEKKTEDRPCTLLFKIFNENGGNVKGVGTALVQSVIEESIQKTEGRIKLESLSEAIGFWYKLGFRFEDKDKSCARSLLTQLEIHSLRPGSEQYKQVKSCLENPHAPFVQSRDLRHILTLYARAKKKLGSDECDPETLLNLYREKRGTFPLEQKFAKKFDASKSTRNLGRQIMYLPDAAIEIWQEVISNPESRQANLEKLKLVPQPGQGLDWL